MKPQVWVWAEAYRGKPVNISLGLLGKARELATQLGGGEVAALATDSTMAQECIESGADKVYVIDAPSASPFDAESWARHAEELVKRHRPDILLFGSTAAGRDIASRLAARLKTGLTAHCIELYIKEINGKPQLVTVLAGWGGNMIVKIICPEKRPQMATVKPGIFAPPQKQARRGEIIAFKPQVPSSRVEVLEVIEEQEKTSSIEQAGKMVAGGWGLNAVGGFKMVEELAQTIHAAVAGTRPAVDAGWLSHDAMIGQSGKTVAPQLLITLGVSGAAQFTTGAMNSKFILAIDKNPDAAIFASSDLGIVGDLKDVLLLLIAKLKEP
jgi:electron transfer flavoprotein alpha subunit